MPGSRPPLTPLEIYVRVGALKRFDTLKRKTAEFPVAVRWDRRKGERRAASVPTPADSRTSDRRAAPPFTWELADFVIVEPEP